MSVTDFTEQRYKRMTASQAVCASLVDLASGQYSSSKLITESIKQIAVLFSIIERQEERIAELSRIVYELAPEYEVIETMSNSDEERRCLVNRYMNHCEDYEQ